MEELFGRVDELLDGLLLEADVIEREALKALNKWLLQFPTVERDGEQVLANDETIAKLMASAKRELERVFAGARYNSLVADLFDSYDEILENAQAIHGELNDLSFTKAFESRVLSPAKQLAVRQASAYLSQASLSAQVIAPLTKVLFEAVQYGYTLSQAQEAIEKRMYFGKYAGQIARDGLFQFDGTVHKAVADEYGLDAIRYVGTAVEDTRGQCYKWMNNGKIPISTLPAEIAWAKRSGEYKGRKKSGMIPETNAQNFHVYRGGYNCRHRAIPVYAD